MDTKEAVAAEIVLSALVYKVSDEPGGFILRLLEDDWVAQAHHFSDAIKVGVDLIPRLMELRGLSQVPRPVEQSYFDAFEAVGSDPGAHHLQFSVNGQSYLLRIRAARPGWKST